MCEFIKSSILQLRLDCKKGFCYTVQGKICRYVPIFLGLSVLLVRSKRIVFRRHPSGLLVSGDTVLLSETFNSECRECP